MILGYKRREEILEKYGLKRPATFLVNDKEEALKRAEEIGFPVVAKISSKKQLHRTEVGGVLVGLKNKKELNEAFEKLSKIEDIEGVIIQKQIKGVELIVGAKRDEVFGPTVMLGTGGIMVELFKDVSFRIAPFEEKEALKMIEEIKGKKLLEGFRDMPIIDKNKLANILVKTSKLAVEENVKELDFNPIIGNESGLYICDVKIAL